MEEEQEVKEEVTKEADSSKEDVQTLPESTQEHITEFVSHEENGVKEAELINDVDNQENGGDNNAAELHNENNEKNGAKNAASDLENVESKPEIEVKIEPEVPAAETKIEESDAVQIESEKTQTEDDQMEPKFENESVANGDNSSSIPPASTAAFLTDSSPEEITGDKSNFCQEEEEKQSENSLEKLPQKDTKSHPQKDEKEEKDCSQNGAILLSLDAETRSKDSAVRKDQDLLLSASSSMNKETKNSGAAIQERQVRHIPLHLFSSIHFQLFPNKISKCNTSFLIMM